MKGLRRLIPYPNIWIRQPPVFVCVKQDSRERYGTRLRRDPYKICQDTGAFGMYLTGWRYVWLCEKFFTMRVAPSGPPNRYCPHVTGNKFVPAEMGRLGDYRTYLLIHEMVHFYLGRESLGWSTTPKESYASNVCVNFDMKTSLRNPMNFQFFVASKSSLTRTLPAILNLYVNAVVEQQCTEAPNPFLPPFPLPPGMVADDEKFENSTGALDVSW